MADDGVTDALPTAYCRRTPYKNCSSTFVTHHVDDGIVKLAQGQVAHCNNNRIKSHLSSHKKTMTMMLFVSLSRKRVIVRHGSCCSIGGNSACQGRVLATRRTFAAFWFDSSHVRCIHAPQQQHGFHGKINTRNSSSTLDVDIDVDVDIDIDSTPARMQQHALVHHSQTKRQRPISLINTILPVAHNNKINNSHSCRSWFSSEASASESSSLKSTQSLEELFPRQEILNPWGSDLVPLEATFLDRSTRYMVQLLTAQHQRLHFNIMATNNHPRSATTTTTNTNATTYYDTVDDDHDDFVLDRATTQRCNRVIENLAGMATTSNVSHGRAARADEVLRAMQAFYNTMPTTTSSSSALAAAAAASLPLPTADTYFMVLRIFAADPTANPERAADICSMMQHRYDEYGQLDHQPNVVHWNQVLSCWAVSIRHENKAFEAANLLQRLKSLQDKNESSSSSSAVKLDTSSYAHVLRACAKSDWNAKSRMLGAEVALKVYSDFRKQQQEQQSESLSPSSSPSPSSAAAAAARFTLAPTTYVYTYFLQAIAHLSGDTKRRIQAAVAAYNDAVDHGCVNEYVLDNFRQALPKEDVHIFRRTVGEKLFGNYTPTAKLLSRLPARAKRNNGSKKKDGTAAAAAAAAAESKK